MGRESPDDDLNESIAREGTSLAISREQGLAPSGKKARIAMAVVNICVGYPAMAVGFSSFVFQDNTSVILRVAAGMTGLTLFLSGICLLLATRRTYDVAGKLLVGSLASSLLYFGGVAYYGLVEHRIAPFHLRPTEEEFWFLFGVPAVVAAIVATELVIRRRS